MLHIYIIYTHRFHGREHGFLQLFSSINPGTRAHPPGRRSSSAGIALPAIDLAMFAVRKKTYHNIYIYIPYIYNTYIYIYTIYIYTYQT